MIRRRGAAISFVMLLSGCAALSPHFVRDAANKRIETIAFVRSDNGVHHIYTAQPDGSNLLQLTNTANSDDYPSWAPDGSALVFSRTLTTGPSLIYRINPDGSGLQLMSQEEIPTDVQPSWAQNGQILYVRLIPFGPAPQSQLMLTHADGSNPTVIYPPQPDGHLYLEPHLSPADGKTVVFAGTGDGIPGSDQIWTINVNGSGLRQLTFNQGTVSGDPTWGNNGQNILYSHRDQSGNVNMWVMDADGSNQRQITPFVEPTEAGDGDFSSTGSLVFEHDVGGNGQSLPDAMADIWTSDGATDLACSAVGCAPRWKPR
jgi:TolB protein